MEIEVDITEKKLEELELRLNDLNFNIIERIVLEDKYIIKKEKSED